MNTEVIYYYQKRFSTVIFGMTLFIANNKVDVDDQENDYNIVFNIKIYLIM